MHQTMFVRFLSGCNSTKNVPLQCAKAVATGCKFQTETGTAASQNMSWRAMRLIRRRQLKTNCMRSERDMEVRSQKDNLNGIKPKIASLSLFPKKTYVAGNQISALDSAHFQAVLQPLRETETENDFERPSIEHCSTLQEGSQLYCECFINAGLIGNCSTILWIDTEI